MSQTQRIESYLKQGNPITPIKALKLFGCLRLAARINDLKRSGLSVSSEIVNKNGKRFAQYRIA
jgi:hypothetical protein